MKKLAVVALALAMCLGTCGVVGTRGVQALSVPVSIIVNDGVAPGEVWRISIRCSSRRAISGGFSVTAQDGSRLDQAKVGVLANHPTHRGDGWTLGLRNDGSEPVTLRAYTYCNRG